MFIDRKLSPCLSAKKGLGAAANRSLLLSAKGFVSVSVCKLHKTNTGLFIADKLCLFYGTSVRYISIYKKYQELVTKMCLRYYINLEGNQPYDSYHVVSFVSDSMTTDWVLLKARWHKDQQEINVCIVESKVLPKSGFTGFKIEFSNKKNDL